MKTDDYVHNLKEEVRKLADLLERPQLGIFSWWDFVDARLRKLEALRRERLGEPADMLVRTRAAALEEAARHCESTPLLIPIEDWGATKQAHGAVVCRALAAELRALAGGPATDVGGTDG